MAPDERTRIELTEWLVQQFGHDLAAYLMEVIPPFGWDEIMTKSDLSALSERIDLKIDGLGHQLSGEFQHQTNRLLMWVVPTVIAAIVVAAALD